MTIRYIYPLLFSAILLAGCCRAPQDEKDILASVNNYRITVKEFDEEFKAYSAGREDTPEARRKFLDTLIDRKLILQDAEKKGLTKDPGFLKMIEVVWEQSLLKIAINKKEKEIAGSIQVSDREIKEAYNGLVKEGRTNAPYDRLYQQIKWDLAKGKQSKEMNGWVADLRKKASIKVKSEFLK
jgi:hypothetical protein